MRKLFTVASFVALLAFVSSPVLAISHSSASDNARQVQAQHDRNTSPSPQTTNRVRIQHSGPDDNTPANDAVQSRRMGNAEQAQQKREEFRQQVEQRLNARDQRIASRVSQGIHRSHENLCRQHLRRLDQMSAILGKIEMRAQMFEEQGADISEVEAAIASARSVIADARTEVNTICDAEYVVEIGEDQSVGEALRETIQQLREDHQSLIQGQLRDGQDAVKRTFLALKDAAGEQASPTPDGSPDPSAPPTATPTPITAPTSSPIL